jgi:hypothetical protein
MCPAEAAKDHAPGTQNRLVARCHPVKNGEHPDSGVMYALRTRLLRLEAVQLLGQLECVGIEGQ